MVCKLFAVVCVLSAVCCACCVVCDVLCAVVCTVVCAALCVMCDVEVASNLGATEVSRNKWHKINHKINKILVCYSACQFSVFR